MTDKQPTPNSSSDADTARKPWATPVVAELAAGSAENTPGTTTFDGPLEAVGS